MSIECWGLLAAFAAAGANWVYTWYTRKLLRSTQYPYVHVSALEIDEAAGKEKSLFVSLRNLSKSVEALDGICALHLARPTGFWVWWPKRWHLFYAEKLYAMSPGHAASVRSNSVPFGYGSVDRAQATLRGSGLETFIGARFATNPRFRKQAPAALTLLLRVTIKYRPAVIEAPPISRREYARLTCDLDGAKNIRNLKVSDGNRPEGFRWQ